MQSAVFDVVARHLPAEGLILAGGRTFRDLPLPVDRLHDDDLDDLRPARYAGAVLTDDELSRAGIHAEELVDALGTALEPGGVLAASVRNRVFAEAANQPLDGLRGYSSAEITAMVNHRGFRVDVLCAPGAAGRLRGADVFDLEADRRPGLLDAGPRLLVIARAPLQFNERERTFFETRPRKLAAAATVCRDPAGRLLVVYDRFRRFWTIPGGVIDADEDPAGAAQRETEEEAGLKVEIGHLLGVFASRWPDRLIFVFEADPVVMVEQLEPIHPHEIGGVAWVPLDEALERLAPSVAFRVSKCLEQPGYSWVQ